MICAKGFEEKTGEFMSEVVKEVLPKAEAAILSGPSFATEVARNLPAALTLACESEGLGAQLMTALAHRNFRLYWTSDVIGTQAGGAVKYVLAIATGIVEGRQLGRNAHAALTTRGFAELVRLDEARGPLRDVDRAFGPGGPDPDLLQHAVAQHVAWHRARPGQALEDILGARKSVTEGVHSAGAVVDLARKHGVEMPICEAVHNVVKGRMNVDEAIEALLSRPLRAETDHKRAGRLEG